MEEHGTEGKMPFTEFPFVFSFSLFSLPSESSEQTWRFVQLFHLWEQTLKCVPGLLVIPSVLEVVRNRDRYKLMDDNMHFMNSE